MRVTVIGKGYVGTVNERPIKIACKLLLTPVIQTHTANYASPWCLIESICTHDREVV